MIYRNRASDRGCNQAGPDIGCNGVGKIFFKRAYKHLQHLLFFSFALSILL